MTDPDATGRLTGTKDRPIERIPDAPSTLLDWVVLLGGPAIWISHFMGVYLLAEVGCGPLGPRRNWAFLSGDSLVALTVAATVLAVVACAVLAVVARRRRRDPDEWKVDFASGGFLLSIGSIIGVVAVGVPAAVLSPVC